VLRWLTFRAALPQEDSFPGGEIGILRDALAAFGRQFRQA
jgi:hypothetical protein